MEDFRINFGDAEEKRKYIDYVKGLEGVYNICHSNVLQHRSEPLNRYYFGVVVFYISRWSGYIPEEVHAILKAHFLPTVTFANDYDLTTTKCTSPQMWSYTYRCRKWGMKHSGRYIPLPNEVIRVPELIWGEKDFR
jgi:hypothetical protein